MAPPNNKGRRIYKVNAVSYAKLIALMLDGTRDNQELADETGLHPVTVQVYARELRRAGAAFISQRRPDELGRHTIKVTQIGRGVDAAPIRKSPMMRARDMRKRRRARSTQGQELVQTWASFFLNNNEV